MSVYMVKNTVDKEESLCYNDCGDSAFVESLSGRVRHGLKAHFR